MVAVPVRAQQLIGYVSTKDAQVSGTPDVVEGKAVLTGAVAVTAKDHTAPISLGRGGTVRVCQTSVLHLTEARAAPMAGQLAAPLLMSLDRGAIEVQMMATPTDALMTPDLRLAVRAEGALDLRMRVAANGDTCVENRGAGAPALMVSDVFGGGSYLVYPGQHVLFEHGSVREVVDHESSPCGCPEVNPGMSIAEALLAPGAGGSAPKPGAAQANAKNPFPEAQSAGLTPEAAAPVVAAPAAATQAQVSEGLAYSGQAGASAAGTATVAQGAGPVATAAAVPVQEAPVAASQPAQNPHRDVVHAIGHFFKKLFGG